MKAAKPAKPKPQRRTLSLSEMAGDAAPRGLACPKCGCIQFNRVAATRPGLEGTVVRYRVCRNTTCGCRWRTDER